MNLEVQYEYYRCVQHDFNESYRIVNKYVAEIYSLPKRFMDSTGPLIDRFIKEYSFDEAGHGPASFQPVLDFIDQLDDFAAKTLDLFNEHKAHAAKSKAYLKRVSELNEKNSGKIISEFAVDYIELTPELVRLNNELKKIKDHADTIVNKLNNLEIKWETIRTKAAA